MYRHAAQINMARSSLPSPARNESTESEADILAELAEKRRELDDEIASFRAQKEKEFRIFERELRALRNAPGSKPRDMQAAKGSSAVSAVSSLFVGKQVRPNGLSKGKNVSDPPHPRSRPSTLPSQATVGVDKLTVNGTTTPPIVGTPPVIRSVSRSPTNLSITPPRKSVAKLVNKRDEEKTDFPGLFTPKYLPLLEARPTASLPPTPAQPKRALTVPAIPSASLPSALRTASGSAIRKRKRVTFQLGDTTIVEPSSSYEELPSPAKQASNAEMDEMGHAFAPHTTPPLPANPDFDGNLVVPKSGGSSTGFFELDEELDDLDDREIDYHEDPDEDQKIEHGEDEADAELNSGSFHAGSLPIDIVRPGSFRSGTAIP